MLCPLPRPTEPPSNAAALCMGTTDHLPGSHLVNARNQAGTGAVQGSMAVAAFSTDPSGTYVLGQNHRGQQSPTLPSFASPIPASLPSSGTCLRHNLSPNMSPVTALVLSSDDADQLVRESQEILESFHLRTLEAEHVFWLKAASAAPRNQWLSVQLPNPEAGCVFEDTSSTLTGPLKQGGRTGLGRKMRLCRWGSESCLGTSANGTAISSAPLVHQDPCSRLRRVPSCHPSTPPLPLALSLSPTSSKQGTRVWPSTMRGPGGRSMRSAGECFAQGRFWGML